MEASQSVWLPLKVKTALVTGSARGKGAATAWYFASDGATIILNHLTNKSIPLAQALETRIRDLPHRPSVYTIRADISTPEGPRTIISTLQANIPNLKIDILINNAGIAPPASLPDLTPSLFHNIMTINLLGPILMTQASLPHLPSHARVINISSLAARQPFPSLAVYGASKAGLEAATRHLALALGGRRYHGELCDARSGGE